MRLEFDRGTLLLKDVPEGLTITQLPGVLWDPRVSAYRAPAWRQLALSAEVVRITGRPPDIVRYAGQTPEPWNQVDLRPYQEAALDAWQLGGRRGLVVLPTGSGKTRVALAAMARTGLRTLCLVPTRVLMEQWMREIGQHYSGKVGCYGDGVRELQPITVATSESAYRHMPRLGDRFDLLVVDEAHHFGCGIRDEALEMSIAEARLGLTATPPRTGPAAERLMELVGRTVYELAIGDLAGGFLASFDTFTLHLDLEPDERDAYRRFMNDFRAVFVHFRRTVPEGSWEDFARAADRTPDGRKALLGLRRAQQLLRFPRAKREAVRQLLKRHRDARVLVFTGDNQTAYAIAREHLIMPLTCDIARAERAEALERFRKGEYRALVSARVLNEGLDVPDADVAIIVAGTLGEREHVQRIGRLLRPAAGKRAIVYELVVWDSSEVRQAARRREGLAPRNAASL